MRYKKKPVEVEAFRLGADYMPVWFMNAVTSGEVELHGSLSGFDHRDDTTADIHTLEGVHHADFGDFIIRGVKGEIYPCKPDIFSMTYEEVDKRAGMPLGFGERENLAALYKKWANDNGARDSAASVVVFLLVNNLLDCDKARELIERGRKPKGVLSKQAKKHMRLQNEGVMEALACCLDASRCPYCPRYPKYGFTDGRQEKRCMIELMNDVWDVIKRLEKKNSVLHDTNLSLQSTIGKLTKEIERLNGMLDRYPVRVKVGNRSVVHSASFEDYEAFIDDVGTEAICEYVKLVKAMFPLEQAFYTWRTIRTILDKAQEEMTPERKEDCR